MALGPADLFARLNDDIADAVEFVIDEYLMEAIKSLDEENKLQRIKVEIVGSCLTQRVRDILVQRYKKAGWSDIHFFPRITTTEIVFMR